MLGYVADESNRVVCRQQGSDGVSTQECRDEIAESIAHCVSYIASNARAISCLKDLVEESDCSDALSQPGESDGQFEGG